MDGDFGIRFLQAAAAHLFLAPAACILSLILQGGVREADQSISVMVLFYMGGPGLILHSFLYAYLSGRILNGKQPEIMP